MTPHPSNTDSMPAETLAPRSMISDGFTVPDTPVVRSPAAANPFTMPGSHVPLYEIAATITPKSANFNTNFAAISSSESRRNPQSSPDSANSMPASSANNLSPAGT